MNTPDGILITFGHGSLAEQVQAATLDCEVGMDSPDLIALAGITACDFPAILRSVKGYKAAHGINGPVVILTFDEPPLPQCQKIEQIAAELVQLLLEEGFTSVKHVHK